MVLGPLSYRDPLYARLAADAEQKYGLPTGILDAIRTRGERSNANQVSPAGAEGVYQFIPSTWRAFVQKFGIDPWGDPQAQTNSAAIHLVEDHKRTGSWDEAIARYNEGTHPGRRARQYAQAVGDFDTDPTSKPYYTGVDQMASASPFFGIGASADPLAPEAMKAPVPIPGDPGPSANVAAAAPVAVKKRGGLLGALESIFMPDPDSRWAGALRDGLTNAKESQQYYRENEASKQIALQQANVKLQQMIHNGEFQVVGNNVFHTRPDGTTEMITAPKQPSDVESLLGQWKSLKDGDPAKSLIERILLKGQSDEALQNARSVAGTRAAATTGAARIRADAPPKSSAASKPPAGFILDQ